MCKPIFISSIMTHYHYNDNETQFTPPDQKPEIYLFVAEIIKQG